MATGPLPPPEQLAHYNEVVPGLAGVIVEEFQENAKHRRRVEWFVAVSDTIRSYLGMAIGGGIAVFIVYTGAQLLREGHTIQGFGAIGSAVAIAAGPFLARTYVRSQERKAQVEAMTGRARR